MLNKSGPGNIKKVAVLTSSPKRILAKHFIGSSSSSGSLSGDPAADIEISKPPNTQTKRAERFR